MNEKSPDELKKAQLKTKSVVAIRREGGVAAFPGLMKPRKIQCADCTDEQRRELEDVLNLAARTSSDTPAPGADRRVFHVHVEEPQHQDAAEPDFCVWSLSLNEEETPEALIALWKSGMPANGDQ
ncbi:protealysin inhibitor emfourin [Halomonas sp. M20]|uniref:protealysin inhibitor emfourin n=1 Tax=Halomonas sp. M20 TaxID=2763264 RepID=UPI001D0A4EB6|nr:protealysin inhibitor emfourin [Halomonas sp. M20]